MKVLAQKNAFSLMRSHGWLALMPEAFREDILARCHIRVFSGGETIFSTGDTPGGIYGLVSGIVSVNSAMPEAPVQMIHLALPGAWTGEGCFMTGQPRRGELRALSRCQMLHLPLAAMEEMAARDSRAIRAFGVISILGVDVLIRIIHDLQKVNAPQRIASVLHRVSGGGTRPVLVSQEVLAEAASASRKVVNASLQRFAERGWIDRRRGYRRLFVLLRREGEPSGINRIYRLYSEEGLRTVAELEVMPRGAIRTGRQLDLEQIGVALLRRPALAATGVVAQAPEHIGLR